MHNDVATKTQQIAPDAFTRDIVVTIINPIFTMISPYYLLNISTPAWNHKVYSIRTRLWPMTLLHAIHVILNHNHRSVKFCNTKLYWVLSHKNYVLIKSCHHEMKLVLTKWNTLSIFKLREYYMIITNQCTIWQLFATR